MDADEDLMNNPWAQFIGTSLENLDDLESLPDYEDPKEQTNTKLATRDMCVYGSCPVWEEFKLTSCRRCNCLVLPAALLSHMVQRHSNEETEEPSLASTSTSTTSTNASASTSGSCSNTGSWEGSKWTANNNASHGNGLQSSLNTTANIVRVKADNKSTLNQLSSNIPSTSTQPPQPASSFGQPMDVSESSSSEKKAPALEKLVLRRVLQTSESTSGDGGKAEGIKGMRKDSTSENVFMVVKKNDCEQNLLIPRKKFRKRSSEVDPEKDAVEKKMRRLEMDRDRLIKKVFKELNEVKDKLHQCTLSKIELQKELADVKAQMEESKKIAEQCRLLSKQNFKYQKEIKELQDKLDSMTASTSNFMEESSVYGNLQAYNYAMEQMAKQLEASEEQKLQFQKRLEDLEAELSELKNSSKLENRNLELKLKHYCRIIGELKSRLDRQVSENEELRSRKEFLEKHLPQEVIYQVKGQLIGITRRAELFEIFPGLISGQPIPALAEKLLADIQNIDYRSFQQQVANNESEIFQQPKDDVS
ncbi:uncharacterized protein TNCT_251771 [Trichonephila clavata]|uniref:Uncharacterized protein n=1 Tax=Trichonephila clavata TaxID=2740835 RepID=A0A8X6I3S6_TRICU|nr:uncharacterized protein TNCT_251771 [Trichonephila clavata]